MFVKRLRVAPTVDSVLNNLHDVGDGRCLASAISFYRPNDLPADGNKVHCVYEINHSGFM